MKNCNSRVTIISIIILCCYDAQDITKATMKGAIFVTGNARRVSDRIPTVVCRAIIPS